MTKVSVVVPVYNAGPYLEPLVDSLVAQTMPARDFEVVFVDDGSTDDSPGRLDALAERLDNVRVVHQPNSGWPGKPRNVGVDLAVGDYVFFVDQDDRLGPEALERLHALATRHGTDIVLPKIAGDAIFNQDLYRVPVDRCTVWEQPLMNTLGPHKLFRRDFLVQHGLRFPEGRRRLEDAVFMGQAYLAAEGVTIQADYPSYYWMVRDDGQNNSRATPTPHAEYYRYVREALDVLVQGVPEGERRDVLLRRYFRTAMFRLSEPRIDEYEADDRAELFDEIRALTDEYFGPGVVDGSPALFRLRGQLVQEGRLDDLVHLADTLASLRCQPRLDDVRWQDGRLRLSLSVQLLLDGTPLTVTRRDGRLLLDPRVTAGLAGVADLDVTEDVEAATTSCSVQGRRTLVRWYAADGLDTTLESLPADPDTATLTWSGSVLVDPLRLAGGEPLDGDLWDVRLHVDFAGLQRSSRVGRPDRDVDAAVVPALLGTGPLAVRPYWTKTAGKLSLDVSTDPRATRKALSRNGVKDVSVARGTLTARVPGTHAAPDGVSWPVSVTVRDSEGHRDVEGRLQAVRGGAQLSVDLSGLSGRRLPSRHVLRVPKPVAKPSAKPSAGIAEVWVLAGRRAVLPPPWLRRLAAPRGQRLRRAVGRRVRRLGRRIG